MKRVGYVIVTLILLCSCANAFLRGGSSGPNPNAPTIFSSNGLAIGSGGFARAVRTASDGTRVARTDTACAYKYNAGATNPGNAGGTGVWQQLCTAASISSSIWFTGDFGNLDGATEIIAYDTNKLYMNFNGQILYSGDGGSTFAKATGFTPDTNVGAYQSFNYLMAVDPQNPDIVYAGSAGHGMFVSTNATSGASASYSLISTGSIPSGTALGVCFDPNSSVSGGKKQGIYVWSEGNGVYRSTNGGTSWAVANASGQPTTFKGMICDPLGNVFVYDDSSTVRKFNGTSWSNLSPGFGVAAMAVDPTHTSNVFAMQGSTNGNLVISTNSGTSWTGTATASKVATDVPWLATSTSTAVGSIEFDPTGVLLYAEGIGIWKTTPPTTAVAFNWTSITTAIEQLVGNWVLAPPSGKPTVYSWDRASFYSNNPTVYPSTQAYNLITQGIVGGWGADWASATPSTLTIAASSNNSPGQELSGKSTDGGQTWTVFGFTNSTSVTVGGGTKTWSGVTTGLPTINVGDPIWIYRTSDYDTFMRGTVSTYSGGNLSISVTDNNGHGGNGPYTDWTIHTIPACAGAGGQIAASTATNYLWICGGFNGGGTSIWYTTDGGVTWIDRNSYFNTNFGIPTTGANGWNSGFGAVIQPMQIAADRVTSGTFYAYNASAGGSGGGIYRTQDGGVTWTKRLVGTPSSFAAADLGRLKAVPNNADHVFFSNMVADGLTFSSDGGATWNALSNVNHIYGFGFGAAFPGKSYPAIYIVGYIGSAGSLSNYGAWRCTDFVPATRACTWTQLSNFPGGSFPFVTDVEGDKVTVGSLYIATQGNGFIYGHL